MGEATEVEERWGDQLNQEPNWNELHEAGWRYRGLAAQYPGPGRATFELANALDYLGEKVQAIQLYIETIHIRLLRENEQPPMDLLFLADPSENLVTNYLKRAKCYLAETNNEAVGEYVLLETRPDTVELVNVAVREDVQGQGIGKRLVLHAVETAREARFRTIEIGTGNSSVSQILLYQKCLSGYPKAEEFTTENVLTVPTAAEAAEFLERLAQEK